MKTIHWKRGLKCHVYMGQEKTRCAKFLDPALLLQIIRKALHSNSKKILGPIHTERERCRLQMGPIHICQQHL